MTTAAPIQSTPIHDLGQKASLVEQTPVSAPAGYTVPRGPVSTKLQFYSPPEDGSPPHNWVETPPEGQPQRNFGDQVAEVTVSDIRGREGDFNLDANAFQAIQRVPASRETEFVDDDSIKEKYYPEVEQLLLENVPGAHRVLFFDHTIRRSSTPGAPRQPVTRVHIDQTPAAAKVRVQRHLGDEAEEFLKGRYRIINVWRPLNGPVAASPLGFADGSTVPNDGIVGVEHRYPDRTGETAAVKFNPAYNWYYWSGMQNDERLLLKCSDSSPDVGAWGRVPHTAFDDPRTPRNAPGRDSIEVRALVFG